MHDTCWLQLLQLLLKASQDKKFVCEEADRALQAMTGSVPPLPLLRKLQSCVSHTNPKVRAKAAVSVSSCVSKMVSLHSFSANMGCICFLEPES